MWLVEHGVVVDGLWEDVCQVGGWEVGYGYWVRGWWWGANLRMDGWVSGWVLVEWLLSFISGIDGWVRLWVVVG